MAEKTLGEQLAEENDAVKNRAKAKRLERQDRRLIEDLQTVAESRPLTLGEQLQIEARQIFKSPPPAMLSLIKEKELEARASSSLKGTYAKQASTFEKVTQIVSADTQRDEQKERTFVGDELDEEVGDSVVSAADEEREFLAQKKEIAEIQAKLNPPPKKGRKS